MSQETIRNNIIKIRSRLTAKAVENARDDIAIKILQHPVFKTSNKIGFYYSQKNEVDPSLAIQNALTQKKQCYLPAIQAHRQLLFAKITTSTPLKPNKHGIMEPDYDIDNLSPPEYLDLVIVPTIAIDKNKNRIGSGSGYYDCSFSFKKDRKIKSPYLLAIVYEFQVVPKY